MSIFESIKNAIFGHGSSATPAAATPAAAAAPASAPPTPAPHTATGTAISQASLDAQLAQLAAKSPQKLNWQTSIVDLLKLVGLDPSFANRKQLAQELGFTGDTADSATMNIWLHKTVMEKLAESGGKVTPDLKNRIGTTMTNIHLVGGEKGGVGKSLVARLLAQYMIDNNIPFVGFDSDRSHGALLRFYAGYASPVLIDRYESLDAIVEASTENPERRILVDLAAQTQERLTQWMDDSQLLEVAPELGLHIRYWHVMDAGKDSVDLLKRLLDRHGSRLNYVLVLNEIRGDDFRLLDQSGEKERALGLGAVVVHLKRLHEASMMKIDASSVSFWAVANKSEADTSGLGLLERQRVKVWLKNAFAEIAKPGI